MSTLFFVHVPKTAGTSFRKAVESHFGKDSVLYDYSANSEETSTVVSELVYEKADFFSFQHQLNSLKPAFLSGHVNASKYVNLFGASQTITFLREPLQRIVSEYYHFVRHNGYEGDLPSFYRKPQFINRQLKMFQGVPLKAVGFLGLNEHYDDSLAMLNSRYNLNIPNISMNLGRQNTELLYDIPHEQRKEILELNKEDVALYYRAQQLFESRLALYKKYRAFVHGDIQQLSDKSISGWAWWGSERKDPVDIQVVVNGEVLAAVVAKQFRSGLLRLSPPRMGYIGFQHHFTKPLKAGTVVEVVAAETGQVVSQRKLIS